MSDERFNQLLALFGGVVVVVGNSGVLPAPWGALVASIGGLIVGQAALPRKGDVSIKSLPAEIQDSVRPPK